VVAVAVDRGTAKRATDYCLGAEVTDRELSEMSEAELAEYYYQHRHEAAGEVVNSTPPGRLDLMVSARFSEVEAAAVRQAAQRAGMSVSAFLRQSALANTDTNVVDLERVRRDVARLRDLASDALRALA
jgi:ribosomal protein L29